MPPILIALLISARAAELIKDREAWANVRLLRSAATCLLLNLTAEAAIFGRLCCVCQMQRAVAEACSISASWPTPFVRRGQRYQHLVVKRRRVGRHSETLPEHLNAVSVDILCFGLAKQGRFASSLRAISASVSASALVALQCRARGIKRACGFAALSQQNDVRYPSRPRRLRRVALNSCSSKVRSVTKASPCSIRRSMLAKCTSQLVNVDCDTKAPSAAVRDTGCAASAWRALCQRFRAWRRSRSR